MYTNFTIFKSKKSKKEKKPRSKSKKKKIKKSQIQQIGSSKKFKSKKSKTRKSKILPQILIQDKLDDDIINDIEALILKNEKKYNIAINQTNYLITLKIDKKIKKGIYKKK